MNFMNTPIMDEQSEIDALSQELRARTAERDALARRLEASPEMREIIAELREIATCLNDRMSHSRRNHGREHLNELLRRLDRE